MVRNTPRVVREFAIGGCKGLRLPFGALRLDAEFRRSFWIAGLQFHSSSAPTRSLKLRFEALVSCAMSAVSTAALGKLCDLRTTRRACGFFPLNEFGFAHAPVLRLFGPSEPQNRIARPRRMRPPKCPGA